MFLECCVLVYFTDVIVLNFFSCIIWLIYFPQSPTSLTLAYVQCSLLGSVSSLCAALLLKLASRTDSPPLVIDIDPRWVVDSLAESFTCVLDLFMIMPL